MKVCLGANTLFYPSGGHVWAYLNWALSLREMGCEVDWLEPVGDRPLAEITPHVQELQRLLEPFGLGEAIVVDARSALPDDCPARPLEAAIDADLLLDLGYQSAGLRRAFGRKVMVDIDPVLTQLWWSGGNLDLDGFDIYFTIGRNVASGTADCPDCGVRWHYVPPSVHLDSWPRSPVGLTDASWTTITHWWGEWQEVDGEPVESSKRAAFLPLVELPRRVQTKFALALGGLDDAQDEDLLTRNGWQVQDSEQVAATPERYRRYVQASLGEFSAAKPLYVTNFSGWLSDRTVCYLASGKPAVVEDTGLRRFFDQEGLLFFAGVDEAAALIEQVAADYERHCEAARRLAEETFDGTRVAARVIERAVDAGAGLRRRHA